MYDDIGGKIKGLAKSLFIIGAFISVLLGIFVMVNDKNMIFVGLFIMVAGSLLAYISSWLIYGFGELIDIAYDIEWNTRGEEQVSTDDILEEGRIGRLEQLRSQGIITEDQFQQELSKK